MYCWGSNAHQEVSSQDCIPVNNQFTFAGGGYCPLPIRVLGIPPISRIGASHSVSCGISNGQVHCWGDVREPFVSRPKPSRQLPFGARWEYDVSLPVRQPIPFPVADFHPSWNAILDTTGVLRFLERDVENLKPVPGLPRLREWFVGAYYAIDESGGVVSLGPEVLRVPGITNAVQGTGTSNVACARLGGGEAYCWGGIHPEHGKRCFPPTPIVDLVDVE